MAYEKKIVAFIDVLGFKNKTDTTNPDQKHPIHLNLLNIKSFIDQLNNFYDQMDDHKKIKSHRFSDSCMFSAPPEAFEYFLDVLHRMQLHFASRDFFLRGAITYDYIYDHEGFFYGRALNTAYKLESSVAVYPRIIFDKKAFNSIDDVVNLKSPEAEDVPSYKRDLRRTHLKKDFDGNICIDFFRQSPYTPEFHEIFGWYDHDKTLDAIFKNITKNIRKYKNQPNLLIKYIWLLENYKNYMYEQYEKEIETPDIYY